MFPEPTPSTMARGQQKIQSQQKAAEKAAKAKKQGNNYCIQNYNMFV